MVSSIVTAALAVVYVRLVGLASLVVVYTMRCTVCSCLHEDKTCSMHLRVTILLAHGHSRCHRGAYTAYSPFALALSGTAPFHVDAEMPRPEW